MAAFDPGLLPFYTTQFSTNVELMLQQKDSLLRGTVTENHYVGKMASPVNQIGPLGLEAPAGIYAPITLQQAPLARPWVFPTFREGAQAVDTFEQLQTVVDPKSGLVQTFTASVGRFWDDVIIAAATSATQFGVDASSLLAQTFSTGSFQIAANFSAGASAGLTLAKIIEARRILRHYHNNIENDPLTLVIGSKQESDILNQVQLINSLYGEGLGVQRDKDGRPTRVLGFDVKVSERLPQTTVGSVRGVLAYVRSGVHLGIWKDMDMNIDQRVDLSGRPFQISTRVGAGGARLQEGKVIQILCADTTGGDITP